MSALKEFAVFLFLQSSWLADHWTSVASAVVLIITQIGVLAKILLAVSHHEKQIERMTLLLEAHVSSMTLHRTPDFEKRLDEFGFLLKEIKHDVATLINQKGD